MTTFTLRSSRTLTVQAAALAAAAALLLAGCSTDAAGGSDAAGSDSEADAIAAIAAKADPTKPESSSITGAVWQGAISAQWFLGAPTAADYGVELKSDWMTDATVGRAQLVAGEIAIVPGSTGGAVQLAQSGVDALIVAGNYESEEGRQVVYVMPDSGITSVADLAGKTLGATAISGSWPNRIRLAMKDAGADPTSLNVVATTYGDMAEQLKSGTVDAVIAASFALPAVKATGAVPVFDVGGGPYAGRPENVWLTTREYYEKNPNTIAVFQCAMLAGAALANQRPEMESYLADTLGWEQKLIDVSPSPISIDGPLDLAQVQADWDDEVAVNGSPEFDVATLVIPEPASC
ncbi:ABC transporter substrate-binding protein [Herbiconiux sp. UC225_62]|uniref:ABC transporter substrate-binding protein n=1 Tax=Herbiconiux sp. UC225_62 TaxID=3350168 RepID=UPI0036D2A373